MAELNRRGFFKGLFGLAMVLALPAPPVVKAEEMVLLEPIVEIVPKQIPLHLLEPIVEIVPKQIPLQSFSLEPGRINRYKGEILQHAVPIDIFMTHGRQVKMPKNRYIARRILPYGE